MSVLFPPNVPVNVEEFYVARISTGDDDEVTAKNFSIPFTASVEKLLHNHIVKRAAAS